MKRLYKIVLLAFVGLLIALCFIGTAHSQGEFAFWKVSATCIDYAIIPRNGTAAIITNDTVVLYIERDYGVFCNSAGTYQLVYFEDIGNMTITRTSDLIQLESRIYAPMVIQ